MKRYAILLLPILVYSKPVKVDEILTDANKFKTDFALSYSNITKKVGGFAPITYQTNGGDFVTIPTYSGLESSNQDYINYGIGLKYGLSKDIEIFSNINFYTSNTHTSGNNFETQSDKGFNNLNIGLIYQLQKEDEKPAVLLGGSVDLLENSVFSDSHKNNQKLKSYSFFASSYYTVDPLVFFLKADYRLNLKKEDNQKSIDNGEMFVLTPQVYFAVNPFANLNWGIKYQFAGHNRVDGQIVSDSGSSVSMLFGGSYEFNSKTILEIDYEKSDNSEYSMNNISLGLSYKF
jgi:hypothetical protein